MKKNRIRIPKIMVLECKIRSLCYSIDKMKEINSKFAKKELKSLEKQLKKAYKEYDKELPF